MTNESLKTDIIQEIRDYFLMLDEEDIDIEEMEEEIVTIVENIDNNFKIENIDMFHQDEE